MSSRLSGRAALVTGGSRGIGAAIAERFAAEGANVVITYAGNHSAAGRMVTRLREAGVKADSIQANVAEPGAAHAVLEKARAVRALWTSASTMLESQSSCLSPMQTRQRI